MVAVIDACGIPDSVLDQAGNHPDVVDALNRQIETQQVVVSLQAELRTIDVDNPGEEGYTLLFSFLHAYNEYFRATRELWVAETSIYEMHGCAMPAIPDWIAAL